MKEIALTQDKVALVDDQDFEWLNQWKWCAKKGKNGRFYAVRGVLENGKTNGYFMHRVILGLTNPKVLVDHRNLNGLDNQRHNLRECSNKQNTRNRTAKKNGSSIFKGITRRKSGLWVTQITSDMKNHYVGTFKTEEEAARAYDRKAVELHKEFANLNFPDQISTP
jgi:uncharacterized protein YycO